MKQDQFVYNRLIEVARSRRVIPLCDVACLLGLSIDCPRGRAEMSRVLDDIACQENAAGRPLLSAVVVQPEIGYPGMGFFLLARELGVNTSCDERSFFYHELKRVHDYWEDHFTPSEAFKIRLPEIMGAKPQLDNSIN